MYRSHSSQIMETMTKRAIAILRDVASDASYSKEAREQCTNEANRLEQELYGDD